MQVAWRDAEAMAALATLIGIVGCVRGAQSPPQAGHWWAAARPHGTLCFVARDHGGTMWQVAPRQDKRALLGLGCVPGCTSPTSASGMRGPLPHLLDAHRLGGQARRPASGRSDAPAAIAVPGWETATLLALPRRRRWLCRAPVSEPITGARLRAYDGDSRPARGSAGLRAALWQPALIDAAARHAEDGDEASTNQLRFNYRFRLSERGSVHEVSPQKMILYR